MVIKRIAAVAGLALALIGCGDDGPDMFAGEAEAGLSGTTGQAQAPGIEVIAAEGAGQEDGHDEATSPEGMDAAADGHGDGDEEMGEASEESGDDAAADGHGDGDEEMGEASEESGDDAAADGHGDGDEEVGEAGAEAGHDAAVAGHEDGDEIGEAGEEAGHDAATDEHDAEVVPDAAQGIVVSVEMLEFGYVLDRDTVPVGEPVTFRIVNGGQTEHEAMFGSPHQQEEFAAAGGHGSHDSGGHHGDIAALTLGSGAAGEIVMVFDGPGEVLIGCHLPGHWEAGMSAGLNVVSA